MIQGLDVTSLIIFMVSLVTPIYVGYTGINYYSGRIGIHIFQYNDNKASNGAGLRTLEF